MVHFKINYANIPLKIVNIVSLNSAKYDLQDKHGQFDVDWVTEESKFHFNSDINLNLPVSSLHVTGEWQRTHDTLPIESQSKFFVKNQALWINDFSLKINNSDLQGAILLKPDAMSLFNLTSIYFDADNVFNLPAKLQQNNADPLALVFLAKFNPNCVIQFNKIKIFSQTWQSQKLAMNYYQGNWVINREAQPWMAPFLKLFFPQIPLLIQ